MGRYYVESVFEAAGLKCAVILTAGFYRNGYVGVPEGHPLAGKGYEELCVDVHGGVTYSDDVPGYPVVTDVPTWWFGFDTMHAGDARDYETAMRELPELRSQIKSMKAFTDRHRQEREHVWTKEEVEEQCRSLAEQLAAYGEE